MNGKSGFTSMQILTLFKGAIKSINTRDVREKVYIFAKPIKNIFSNFIQNETILCDVKYPQWISNKIKKQPWWTTLFYESFF